MPARRPRSCCRQRLIGAKVFSPNEQANLLERRSVVSPCCRRKEAIVVGGLGASTYISPRPVIMTAIFICGALWAAPS